MNTIAQAETKDDLPAVSIQDLVESRTAEASLPGSDCYPVVCLSTRQTVSGFHAGHIC